MLQKPKQLKQSKTLKMPKQNELKHIKKMISHGATIIDIGCASTKPGVKLINEQEELNNITEKLKTIRKEFYRAFCFL